jgi:hypothetical protein
LLRRIWAVDNVQDAKCPFAHGRGEVAFLTNGSAQQSPRDYRIFAKKVYIRKGVLTWRIDEAVASAIAEGTLIGLAPGF